MSFFVFGINHKRCPVEVRERLCLNGEALRSALRACKARREIAEALILSTCNRTEFYGLYEGDRVPAEAICSVIEEVLPVTRDLFLPYVEAHEGRDAVRYIFRVAAGLESMVVGENEIMAQLKEAFREANEAGSVHSVLYRLMEKALKAGKEVRHQTRINEGAASIPSVAVELAEKIFGKLAGEKVMVLGTGHMSMLTLKNLQAAGADIAYVVSRDALQGEKTAAQFNAEWLSFSGNWDARLPGVDILIASTAAPEPVVHYPQIEKAMAERKGRPLFLIDIAVPRNIEAPIDRLDDVYLYNIDDLKGVAEANLKLRKKEIRDAEKLTDQAVLAFSSWLEQLKARPTIETFENFLDEILEGELSRGLGPGSIDESRKNEIKERIRSKLVHYPIRKIKEASDNGGVRRYLEALHSLFGLDRIEREEDPKKKSKK